MPIAYPYKWSDWYGYDKDCSPSLTGFFCSKRARGNTAGDACNFTSLLFTYYHDGSNTLPVAGDTVYNTNSALPLNYLAAGYYKISLSPSKFMYINPNGLVDTVAFCII